MTRRPGSSSLAALFLTVALVLTPTTPHAETGLAARAVETHILPGYSALARETAALVPAAAACDLDALRAAYHSAFDAWMQIQHIAFGPIEQGDRRFAIAFWPDTKGFTRKALSRLIAARDPVVEDDAAFGRLSVAARGLFAIERLLFEGDGFSGEDGAYRCGLALAISRAIARTSADVLSEWTTPEGAAASFATAPEQAVAADLFRSIDGGLEALSALRIGRPLGTPERVWPRRAEAWRSGRSARNIQISLASLQAMFDSVFAPALTPETQARLASKFVRTQTVVVRMPQDFTAIETDALAKLRLEAAQARIRDLQQAVRETLAPALGIPVGFNSLDGD